MSKAIIFREKEFDNNGEVTLPLLAQQMDFWDRFGSLCPAVQKAIKEKYDVYADVLVPCILANLSFFKAMYADLPYCPSEVVLFYMVMLFILQHKENLSVDEILFRANTDVSIQYLLFTTGIQKKILVSRSYFFEFMRLLNEYEQKTGICPYEELFKEFTSLASKEMGINLCKQLDSTPTFVRMDSMLIDTFAEHLSRAEILYRVNRDSLNLIAQLHGLMIIPEYLHHYLEDGDDRKILYRNTEEQRSTLLETLINDACTVKALFTDDLERSFDEYKILERCIQDQSKVDENGNVIPKKGKEIEGSSLQTPEDTEATYRRKYGPNTGHAICFAEAFDGKGNALLYEILTGPNVRSDDDFMKEHIQRKDANGPLEFLSVDAGFFNISTAYEAQNKGIILFPTCLKGSLPSPLLGEFVLTKDGTKVRCCPAGNKPLKDSQRYDEEKGLIYAKFDKETCLGCPNHGACPVKDQAKACVLVTSKPKIDLALFVAGLGSEEYKEFADLRNAIESVPSVMRRQYEVDTLRTMKACLRRSMIFASCINYNCRKLQEFRKKVQKPEKASLAA